MKNRHLAVFLGSMLCFSLATYSQSTALEKKDTPDKPALFTKLPARSVCSVEAIRQLFNLQNQAAIAIPIGGGKFLAGKIVERIQRSAQVTCINIQLTDYPGAIFNLSLVQENGKAERITGVIVHPRSGDVLILSQDKNGFALQKQQQKHFVTE